MPRSHPPTLLTRVKRVFASECRLERGAHILLGVSGGPDSMALLHVLAVLRRRFGFVLSAHGVDHGFRAAAVDELGVAREFSAGLGVPFTSSRLRLAPGGNLQARAREGRYVALRDAAALAGAHFIATAHQANDRAETVLLRLLRGAGVSGLGVLPPCSGDLVRPMIRASRADVETHLARHEVPHCQDPSNLDARFLRVRVRRELMPLLEELSPRIVRHLTSLADQALGEAPPELVDPDGRPVSLSRAQVAQLTHVLQRGSPAASVALSHGREIRLDPATGKAHIVAPSDAAPPGRGQGRDGTKAEK